MTRTVLDVKPESTNNVVRPATEVRGQRAATTYALITSEIEVRSEAELLAQGYTEFAAEDRAIAEGMLPVGNEALTAVTAQQ